MWEFVVTWVWYVLPVFAGIVCLLKGHYWWAMLGLLPLSVGITVGAIEDSLGRPDWLSTIGGMALYAIFPSPLAIVGAVQPRMEGSHRSKPRHTDPREPSWRTRITGLSSVSTGAVVVGVSALTAALVLSVAGLVEQVQYQAALTAEPVGETAVTDFQFSPNFNTGEVWTVSGSLNFGPDYAEIPPWTPGHPVPSVPTHPRIDHGPKDGPPVELAYGVRLHFHDPLELQGEHEIRVTCRIKGHEDPGFGLKKYRLLDACRDLEEAPTPPSAGAP